MDVEKLVEECDALILNCSGDTRMMARAVIRCTLKWVAAKDDAITTGDILLAAGEMSRQEIRTVCAVLRWRSDRLRSFVSTLEAANAR